MLFLYKISNNNKHDSSFCICDEDNDSIFGIHNNPLLAKHIAPAICEYPNFDSLTDPYNEFLPPEYKTLIIWLIYLYNFL